MKKFYLKAVFVFIILVADHQAQQFGRGLILDEGQDSEVIVSASLMRGDFDELPINFSLKKFTPTPGYQGSYSTCAGWACAYSARTILNAIKNKYITPLIDQNAFSPSYIYNQIRKDSTCNNGVDLKDALELMKEQGVLSLNDFGYECERKIESQDKYRAGQNKILEYKEIFNRNSLNKISVTRKSISEYRPVVVAMNIPNSFELCFDVWKPVKEDFNSVTNGHALVVISYDDTLYGGAFEIINSWGTDWGNAGYTWITYKDFEVFAHYAFEIIDDIEDETAEFDLSGMLNFRLEDGTPMELKINDKIFKTVNSFPSGTKFNVHLSNNQPAFVYSFGSDLKKKNTMIFPQKENISPLLAYRRNNIALPNEQSHLMLDNNKGKSYFCFIYSNKSIDIKTAIKKIEKSSGDFTKRVHAYFKNDIVKDFNPNVVNESKIVFETKSEGKSMIIIIVEIDHI